MPWPVYSETFIRTTLGGVYTTYTVPAGRRAVVKTSIFCSTIASVAEIALRIAGVNVINVVLPVSPYTRVDNFTVVAYGGQQIQTYAALAGIHQTVTGYLFSESQLLRGRPPDTDELPYEDIAPLALRALEP